MTIATGLKRFMRETASFAMHFAHGGLLVAGILVTGFLFAHVGSAESHERGLLGFGDMIAEGRAYKAGEATLDQVASTSGVQATVDYLSRRYRVAATAIEPLVLAAQTAGGRTGLDPMLLVAVMVALEKWRPWRADMAGLPGADKLPPEGGKGSPATPAGQKA